MVRVLKIWAARGLAALLLGGILSQDAVSGELGLPQNESAPVIVPWSEDGSDPSERLAVFVGGVDGCCAGRTPMAGRYVATGEGLAFYPAFGFDPGQDYVARLRRPEGDEMIAFRLPGALSAQAAVTEVFPSGAVLPENTLRFYLHFSVPMQPHVAFDYIRLRDASGAADDAAFMRFKQELWNADRTRLTVLLDPGRIKREVATNRALGPALLAGGRYRLDVDGGWPSADGQSVLSAFSKPFRVTDALRLRPDANRWRVRAPCAGTRAPLVVTFDRPFDRHVLERALRLEDGAGDLIQGSVKIGSDEQGWTFTPQNVWGAEQVRLVAEETLEDVAGNNFRDLLDHVAGSEDGIGGATQRYIRLSACAD